MRDRRPAIFLGAAWALAGCLTTNHTFTQRGTVAAPRAPDFDGQPLTGRAQIEVHAGTLVSSPIDVAGPAARPGEGAGTRNPAAVTRHRFDGGARFAVADGVDLGFALGAAWARTRQGVDGNPLDAPDEVVGDLLGTLRVSVPMSSGASLGLAADLGVAGATVYREGDTSTGWPMTTPPSTRSTGAALARVALVPSQRLGPVVLFGSAGITSEAKIPPTVRYTDNGYGDPEDPGAVAETGGPALTLGAGASVRAAPRTHITAHVGDVYSSHVAGGHYGPQADIGVAFDLR